MRITLESLHAGHAPEMFPVLSDPAIYTYISEAPPASVEAVAERHGRQLAGKSSDGSELWFNWIVRENATGKAIGYVQATVIGDRAWIAYVLAPSSWGKGLGREATEAMMEIVRERNAPSLFLAEADKRNAASIGLLCALGFVECPGAKDGEQRFELRTVAP
jgi:ribosomal-protein-alanine N-acetyltransferase